MVRVVHEVTSGSKLTKFVLVKVPAHFFAQDGLVHDQLFHAVGKKTIILIDAVSHFSETFAKLQFAFARSQTDSFIIHYHSTHDQFTIILYNLFEDSAYTQDTYGKGVTLSQFHNKSDVSIIRFDNSLDD